MILKKFIDINIKSAGAVAKMLRVKVVNSSWILFEKISKIAIYFIIGILLARYLGANDFGIYSLIITILTIASALAALGLNGILVKEYVIRRNLHKVFVSGFLVRSAGVVLGVTATLVVLWVWFNEVLELYLIVLVSISVIFSLVQVADLYFEAKLQSSVIAKYRILGYVFSAGLKIYLLVYGYNYSYLILAHLFELLIIFFLGYVSLLRRTDISKLRDELSNPDAGYILSLLSKGWPLMISGIAVLLYMKIDQFFISEYLDYSDVGMYSAATRLCEGLFLISAIVIPSFFPSMVRYKQSNNNRYFFIVEKLTTILFLIGIVIAFVIFLLSKEIIILLYGIEYLDSHLVLRIYAISIPIVYIGDVLSRWLIIENLLMHSMLRHFLGLIANITLNIILIPIYGIEGAAVASVVGYVFSVIVFALLAPKLRLFLRVILYKNTVL